MHLRNVSGTQARPALRRAELGSPAQHSDERGEFLLSVAGGHDFLGEPQECRKLGVDPGFASLFHKQFEFQTVTRRPL